MLEYRGKYTSCLVMIDDIEETAVTQIYNFLNSPAFAGSKIRIMPDVHAGIGAVVGFTGTLTDRVIPNVVGVDIGCGVSSVCLGDKWVVDLEKLDRFIRTEIPSGPTVHERAKVSGEVLEEFVCTSYETEQESPRVIRSLRTLGGGNHFIELGTDQNMKLWLTIHTGSRNFGLKIAQFHQRKAVTTVGKGSGLEWLEGKDRELYLRHMEVAQRYAAYNRKSIQETITSGFFGFSRQTLAEFAEHTVESVHNYIDFQDNMIRKGAISAHKGQRVVIPWNMRDGLVIGVGKGNPEWNQSAPHGAGRVLARGQAKRTLQLEDFEKSMNGIWTSCVSLDTIDESPMAYKSDTLIRDAIADTVEVTHTIKPIYNFKAS